METNRGECTEGGAAALRAIAAARAGGQQKSADRTVAGIGGGSNHFAQGFRAKMGASGIRTDRLRTNAGAGFDVDGEMGQETQKDHAKKNGKESRLEEITRGRLVLGDGLGFYFRCRERVLRSRMECTQPLRLGVHSGPEVLRGRSDRRRDRPEVGSQAIPSRHTA